MFEDGELVEKISDSIPGIVITLNSQKFIRTVEENRDIYSESEFDLFKKSYFRPTGFGGVWSSGLQKILVKYMWYEKNSTHKIKQLD